MKRVAGWQCRYCRRSNPLQHLSKVERPEHPDLRRIPHPLQTARPVMSKSASWPLEKSLQVRLKGSWRLEDAEGIGFSFRSRSAMEPSPGAPWLRGCHTHLREGLQWTASRHPLSLRSQGAQDSGVRMTAGKAGMVPLEMAKAQQSSEVCRGIGQDLSAETSRKKTQVKCEAKALPAPACAAPTEGRALRSLNSC